VLSNDKSRKIITNKNKHLRNTLKVLSHVYTWVFGVKRGKKKILLPTQHRAESPAGGWKGLMTQRQGWTQCCERATARDQVASSSARRSAPMAGSNTRSDRHWAAISSRDSQKPTARPAR
jgi:hypothetical protein